MSETPEERVIKEALLDMKVKIAKSRDALNKQYMTTSEYYSKLISEYVTDFKQTTSEPSHSVMRLIIDALQTSQRDINSLMDAVIGAVDDMTLYQDTLENYSSQLDDKLDKIFEQANMIIREQQRQQTESKDKTSQYRV